MAACYNRSTVMTDADFLAAIRAIWDAGDTRGAVAARIGVEPKTLERWMNGTNRPSPAKKEQVIPRLAALDPSIARGSPARQPVARNVEEPVMSSSRHTSSHPLRESIIGYAQKLPDKFLLDAATYLEGLWRRCLPDSSDHERSG